LSGEAAKESWPTEKWLADIEARDPVFPDVDWRYWR